MKGISLARDTAIKVALLLVVLGIIIFFVYFYIYRYYLPNYALESRITQLCPEWVGNGCTQDSAGSLSIDVDGTPTSLEDLCSDHYGGSWYSSCREKCMGCP